MPLSQRREMLQRGFRSSSYELYNFAENNPNDYLPDALFRRVTDINGPFCQNILNDKLLFSVMLEDYFKVPQVLGLIERGVLYPVQQEIPFGGATTLLNYCRSYSGVVLKPSTGWQGQGISSVRVLNGTPFLNGQPTTEDAVGNLVAQLDNYLVTELIEQDGYAHEIFPDSANSIRITTMQDPDQNDSPFIPVAVHRFGSKSTVPTDNVSRGGLFANIDLDTGVMGQAIKFPYETGGKLTWCSHHPDTGTQIEGVHVPNWTQLKAQILETVNALKFLKYVGWDIVVAQGEVWLIEANHNPTLAVQRFCPYLKNLRTRRFFEFHGVV